MVLSNNAINNTVGASISGVTNLFTLTNGSNTASSQAKQLITVGGASAGDPWINFNVNGATDWSLGIDNDSTDSLKISQAGTLGSTDSWIMTTSGERTLPRQPAFYATANTSQLNATGDGTVVTVIYDNEFRDIGGNYNNATGVFTAPVDGFYGFVMSLLLQNLTASHVGGIITFQGTGAVAASIQPIEVNPANLRNGMNLQLNGSHFTFMDAGDTMSVTVQIAGGTKTVTVGGAANTQFSGCLMF